MTKSIKKVFICEDDEAIIEIITLILEQKGYQVDFSTDGIKAVKKIQEIHPDLLIIDLWVPNLSGEQIVKKIREIPEVEKTPVILFSASREIQQIADQLRISDYLSKPFNINELEEKVDRLLPI